MGETKLQVGKLEQACEAEDTWPGPYQSQSIFSTCLSLLSKFYQRLYR